MREREREKWLIWVFPVRASTTVICFQWGRVFKGCIEKVEFWKLWLKRLHLLGDGGRRREICPRCQLYSSHQSEAPKHTPKDPRAPVHPFRLEDPRETECGGGSAVICVRYCPRADNKPKLHNLQHRSFLANWIEINIYRWIPSNLIVHGHSLLQNPCSFSFLWLTFYREPTEGPVWGQEQTTLFVSACFKLWPTVLESCHLIPPSHFPTKKRQKQDIAEEKKRLGREGGKKSQKQTTARQLRSISCSMLFRSPRPFRCTNRAEGRTRSWIETSLSLCAGPNEVCMLECRIHTFTPWAPAG